MCRLLAYASRGTSSFPDAVGPHFQEFVQLSSIHHDGWGIADDHGNLTLDTSAAKDSAKFPEAISATQSDAALLHLRWASPGIPVDVSNNHPFKFGDYSFIHNGSLHPYDALDSVLTDKYKAEIKSASDSHRYFMFLIQNIDSSGLVDGIQKTISEIRTHATYASLNSMMLTPEYLVIINEHDVNNRPSIVDELYYDLHYKLDGDSFAIASSGWNQEGWEFLPNHSIMLVHRHDLTMQIMTIPTK